MFEIMFKALGELTRLKILKLLAVKDCVCDLEEIMRPVSRVFPNILKY